MGALGLPLLPLLACLPLAACTEPRVSAEECVIELRCRECVPDAMPLVEGGGPAGGGPAGGGPAGGGPAGGRLRVAPGAALALACRGSRFLAYPTRDALRATCEAGRWRLQHDGALRHLLELGCQADPFEDVLHEVEHCGAPHQGRAYQAPAAGAAAGAGGGARHLATLCFDADRALALWARAGAAAALPLPAHRDGAAPRSLLGNFNQMFDASTRADAERLYGDDERLNRRLRELLRPDGVTLAGHELTAASLLAPDYFEGQDLRVADFASGRVAVWRAVARGNLAHLQRDVAERLRAARAANATLELWTGTHGTATLRTGAGAARELLLRAGRFPVPRYVWVLLRAGRRALAVVLLNAPLVAVSEVREAVFCESACARAPWLRRLLRARNYETPALGLVFCCDAHGFAAAVPEFPRAVVRDVPAGSEGMLTDDAF